MPYVPVPKDLSKVKTKVAFNLTKRQLICFGISAAVGVPTYFLAKGSIGNSPAVLVMVALMLPGFFFGMYEKDGLSAEKILKNLVRHKICPENRPYKTDNLYNRMSQKEEVFIAQKQNQEANKSGKKTTTKHQERKTKSI